VTGARRVAANGIELAYDVLGDVSSPPMVLLHGLGEQRTGWPGVRDRFAERFRVFAFDLRGHGDSDWPGEYSSDLMAADVCSALDGLGLTGVVLVGHSMGGGVAYRVVSRRPDLVGRLVIEDAPPPYPRERALPEEPDQPVPFDWPVVPAIFGEVGAEDQAAWERLSGISAPTLVVGGGPGSHVPQERLAEVAARIPDCTLVTIDAGHHVHTTSPDEFADTVLGWLGDRHDADR
jgi:pimeloyl-ACP methyl ester carboxylesterase